MRILRYFTYSLRSSVMNNALSVLIFRLKTLCGEGMFLTGI